MGEPRMPTTLPSPVDRGEFRFIAVDASGAMWHWIDDEMVWARRPARPLADRQKSDGRRAGSGEVPH